MAISYNYDKLEQTIRERHIELHRIEVRERARKARIVKRKPRIWPVFLGLFMFVFLGLSILKVMILVDL